MKKTGALLFALLFAALPAVAALDTPDPVPAATLLLPYFEVDLMNPNGAQTSFTVANAGATVTVAHVTLWTDQGVPSYSFSIVLPAKDLVEIDLRLLFVRGLLPQSSPAPVPACAGLIPPPQLDPATVIALQRAHTGQSSTLLSNNCGGAAEGDGKARGFVTVDASTTCASSSTNPTTAGYFAIASTQNVLWGDFTFIDRANGFAHADALVHIEAAPPGTYTAGNYTFYGRLLNETPTDAREPLPQMWLGRYDFSRFFDRTDALVWRDAWPQASFPCASPPPGLTLHGVGVFDTQEQPVGDNTTSIPRATQRIDLTTSPRISIPFDAGWLAYDLRRTVETTPGSVFGLNNQGHVTHIFRSSNSAGQLSAWPRNPLVGGTFENAFASVFNAPCSDGADNDDDGFVDYPDDPGCLNAQWHTEEPQCSDGFDNDGAEGTDYPNDPSCFGPADDDESFTGPCQDNVDNDGDGKVDFPEDPGCFSPFEPTEYFGLCDDGLDNDSPPDGRIDFGFGPTNDPGCDSFTDNDESNPECSDGLNNDGEGGTDYPNDPGCSGPQDTTESPNPQCNDGISNDADGLIDMADPGCASPTSNNESPQCNDGVNNDGDGLIDMSDPGCASPSSDIEAPQCNNGFDNDNDQLIDLADPGCSSASDNSEGIPCSDGIDNDGDGLIDYPNETGCSAPNDLTEGPDCAPDPPFNFDADNDGAPAFPEDPGCASAADLNEFGGTTTRGCADGFDNDGDGLTDYPADPGCTSRYDDSEFNQ